MSSHLTSRRPANVCRFVLVHQGGTAFCGRSARRDRSWHLVADRRVPSRLHVGPQRSAAPIPPPATRLLAPNRLVATTSARENAIGRLSAQGAGYGGRVPGRPHRP
jgi:hypothetical protein